MFLGASTLTSFSLPFFESQCKTAPTEAHLMGLFYIWFYIYKSINKLCLVRCASTGSANGPKRTLY